MTIKSVDTELRPAVFSIGRDEGEMRGIDEISSYIMNEERRRWRTGKCLFTMAF